MRSLALGSLGGGVAHFMGIPLAWMLGPLLLTMLLSLNGVNAKVPGYLTNTFKGVVGILLGTAITPETMHRLVDWPMSLLIVVIGLLVVSAVVALFYSRICGFDRITAAAAALPGSINAIPAIAIGMGANAQRTILPQLLRVALVVTCVPPLYLLWQGQIGAAPEVETLGHDGFDFLGQGLWVCLVAPLGWLVAKRIRIPVPQLLGPMLVAAALSLAGFSIQLPAWLTALTFLVLGTSIGARFHDMRLRTLFGTGRHALAGTLLTFFGVALIGLAIHHITGVPLPVALLAVVPGGIAEMALLATALGVDPVFVTFHQVLRSVLLNSIAPFVFQWAVRARKSDE